MFLFSDSWLNMVSSLSPIQIQLNMEDRQDDEREDVSTTDLEALAAKWSVVKNKYMDDPNLIIMAPLLIKNTHTQKHSQTLEKKAPLIHRGYWSRMAAIQKCVENFVHRHMPAEESQSNKHDAPTQVQVVSLGAGSDTLYFRLMQNHKMHMKKYVEVDVQKTVTRKAQTLLNEERMNTLKKALEQCKVCGKRSEEIPSSDRNTQDIYNFAHYALVVADLRNVEQLKRALHIAGIDRTLPTLFISECVLVYLEPHHSMRVLQFIAQDFPAGSAVLAYEQLHPHDAFGKVMVHHLQQRGWSLYGLMAYPDLNSQQQRYKTAGFTNYSGRDMLEVYKHFIDQSEVKRIEKLELFDELEEWNLIQQHYHLSLATQGKNNSPIAGLKL